MNSWKQETRHHDWHHDAVIMGREVQSWHGRLHASAAGATETMLLLYMKGSSRAPSTLHTLPTVQVLDTPRDRLVTGQHRVRCGRRPPASTKVHVRACG